MEHKEICFIINPMSGQVHRGEYKYTPVIDIIDFFCEKKIPITIKTTTAQGDGKLLAEKAVKMGYTHIVACGGDGTINEVVNGMAGSDAVLGILPMGTENILGKAMNIPIDIKEACRHFLVAKEKEWDLGVANGKYFLIQSGMGLDAEVISQVEKEQELKKAFGTFGFVLKAGKMLLEGNPTNKIRTTIRLLDKGEEHTGDAMLIIVGNMAEYGGQLRLALKARPDDGQLDIAVFPYPENELDFIGVAVDVLMENHLTREDVSYFTSKEFEIITDPPVYCQMDGEIIGKTPVKYSVSPKAIKVKF